MFASAPKADEFNPLETNTGHPCSSSSPSLIGGLESLFLRKFSLIAVVGNSARNGWDTRVLGCRRRLERRNFEISLQNSLFAGILAGDWRDHHCVASQPVAEPEKIAETMTERAAMAGL
jgi:hypothetical protein